MSKLHRSRLDTSLCTRRSGSSQLASDETLSRTACTGTELHCKPTRSVDQLREMCPSPTLRPQAHGPDDVRLNTVIGISAGGSEANVTTERQGTRLPKSRTEASKEEGDTTNNDRVQHCVNSGAASSATISSGTPVRREISTPPSPQSSPNTRRWRLFVVSILQKERMRVRRENAQMMEEDL